MNYLCNDSDFFSFHQRLEVFFIYDLNVFFHPRHVVKCPVVLHLNTDTHGEDIRSGNRATDTR